MACERYFSHLLHETKACTCVMMIHNQMTLKSIIYGISPCGFLQCDQMQCHMKCGILLVLRHLASMLWMYYIIIQYS